MANLLMIIGIIETVFVILFANQNGTHILNLSFNEFSFSVNFLTLSISIYILGIVAGVLIMFNGIYVGFKKFGSAKRMLEKQSVSADDYELKIKALENKVQTLEAALSKALKKD